MRVCVSFTLAPPADPVLLGGGNLALCELALRSNEIDFEKHHAQKVETTRNNSMFPLWCWGGGGGVGSCSPGSLNPLVGFGCRSIGRFDNDIRPSRGSKIGLHVLQTLFSVGDVMHKFNCPCRCLSRSLFCRFAI